MPNHELTAEHVQLVGELLIPKFKEAVRQELHKLREDLQGAVNEAEAQLNERIDALDARLKLVEGVVLKASLACGVLALVGGFLGKTFGPLLWAWIKHL